MIKIIKHGHPPYLMTCRYCQCQFTFEDVDVHTNDKPEDYIEWIDCPECKRFNQIFNRAEYYYHDKDLTSN